MTDIFTYEEPPVVQDRDALAITEYLSRQMLALESFLKATYAGHAGLYLSAPTTGLASITPTPQKVGGFDRQQSGEVGALSILANSTIQFLETGIWIVGIQLKFDVVGDSSNETREVEVQFYNETDAVALDVISSASIPRYGELVTLPGVIMVDIRENSLKKEFALYIYSPSLHTITVTQVDVLDYWFMRGSNFTHSGV